MHDAFRVKANVCSILLYSLVLFTYNLIAALGLMSQGGEGDAVCLHLAGFLAI